MYASPLNSFTVFTRLYAYHLDLYPVTLEIFLAICTHVVNISFEVVRPL